MPHDPARVADAKAWLQKAAELATAREVFDAIAATLPAEVRP